MYWGKQGESASLATLGYGEAEDAGRGAEEPDAAIAKGSHGLGPERLDIWFLFCDQERN